MTLPSSGELFAVMLSLPAVAAAASQQMMGVVEEFRKGLHQY